MLLIVSDNLLQKSWQIGSLTALGLIVSRLKRMCWSRVFANFNNLQLVREASRFPNLEGILNIAKRFCMGLESSEIKAIKDLRTLHSNSFQSLRSGGITSIAYVNGVLFAHRIPFEMRLFKMVRNCWPVDVSHFRSAGTS